MTLENLDGWAQADEAAHLCTVVGVGVADADPGRVMVGLGCEGSMHAWMMLTPEAARQVAAQLLDAADLAGEVE